MANRALWEVLDKIKIKYDDIDAFEFADKIESEMGEDYHIEVWDHDDYNMSDLPESIVETISNTVKGKIVEDLQIQTYETDDPGDEVYFTVVALKIKEV